MDSAELFRKTLKSHLKEMPRGTQSRIADELGMERRYLNDFLNGRKMLSESKREEIAEKLGYSYIDFLILGREIDAEIDAEYVKPSDKHVGPLKYAIETLENLVTTIFGNSIKLSSEMKAKAIISIYNTLTQYDKNAHKINIYELIKAIDVFDDDIYFKQTFGIIFDDLKDISFLESPLGLKAHLIASWHDNPQKIEEIKEDMKKVDRKDLETEIKEGIKAEIIDITQRLKRAA